MSIHINRPITFPFYATSTKMMKYLFFFNLLKRGLWCCPQKQMWLLFYSLMHLSDCMPKIDKSNNIFQADFIDQRQESLWIDTPICIHLSRNGGCSSCLHLYPNKLLVFQLILFIFICSNLLYFIYVFILETNIYYLWKMPQCFTMKVNRAQYWFSS